MDTLAEFVGYRGRLEGAGGTLWLNLSGIVDDWRGLGDTLAEFAGYRGGGG